MKDNKYVWIITGLITFFSALSILIQMIWDLAVGLPTEMLTSIDIGTILFTIITWLPVGYGGYLTLRHEKKGIHRYNAIFILVQCGIALILVSTMPFLTDLERGPEYVKFILAPIGLAFAASQFLQSAYLTRRAQKPQLVLIRRWGWRLFWIGIVALVCSTVLYSVDYFTAPQEYKDLTATTDAWEHIPPNNTALAIPLLIMTNLFGIGLFFGLLMILSRYVIKLLSKIRW